MVICRGAACIFFWEIYMLSFLLCQKAFAKILGYLQISLFCVFLINSLFVIFQKSVYCIMAVVLTKTKNMV